MNNYLEAREGMEKLLDLTADAIEGFNRREYTESFKSLYVRMVPTFDAIEELYVSVNEPDTMISNMAQALTANARGRLQSERVRRKKDMIQMNLNMQMVAFVLPGILDYKGQSSRPLADEIITDPGDFSTVRESLEKKGIPMASADVTMIPQNYVSVTDESNLNQLNRILDLLDEDDDIQAVYTNLEEE